MNQITTYIYRLVNSTSHYAQVCIYAYVNLYGVRRFIALKIYTIQEIRSSGLLQHTVQAINTTQQIATILFTQQQIHNQFFTLIPNVSILRSAMSTLSPKSPFTCAFPPKMMSWHSVEISDWQQYGWATCQDRAFCVPMSSCGQYTKVSGERLCELQGDLQMNFLLKLLLVSYTCTW